MKIQVHNPKKLRVRVSYNNITSCSQERPSVNQGQHLELSPRKVPIAASAPDPLPTAICNTRSIKHKITTTTTTTTTLFVSLNLNLKWYLPDLRLSSPPSCSCSYCYYYYYYPPLPFFPFLVERSLRICVWITTTETKKPSSPDEKKRSGEE